MDDDEGVTRDARLLWDYLAPPDAAPRAAEVIVGLGSHDLRVADRCAELLEQRYAPKVLFTGLVGRHTRGLFAKSEAATFADRALAAGVPGTAILLEERATNTGENIRFARDMLPSVATAIFVTKPHMRRRCHATVALHWPEVGFWVTSPATALIDQPLGQVTARDVVCELVGELERLEIYPRLGFQVAVDIPITVRDAGARLRRAGFTDRLPETGDPHAAEPS